MRLVGKAGGDDGYGGALKGAPNLGGRWTIAPTKAMGSAAIVVKWELRESEWWRRFWQVANEMSLAIGHPARSMAVQRSVVCNALIPLL